jgi:hypothetical protein
MTPMSVGNDLMDLLGSPPLTNQMNGGSGKY